ncbi:MAG: hypothetical protein GY737_17960 [Desulfobacteraceae bacterium]|nr:hypothetical protein [Desulfobacteraceae bacterium]
MGYLLRGALIEYGSDFLGPVPNVVIFQFNPESLTRNMEIPRRPTGTGSRERSQAGDAPVERIRLTAHFSAADQLNRDAALARAFGIGPQLAALEKMVHPAGKLSGAIGEALDAVGSAVSEGGDTSPTQPIPRESYPRILFIWGLTRVLPVVIDSMGIVEQHFDPLLNPVQAEVSLGLSVMNIDPCSDDKIAKGAMEYSNLAKDAQALANLANTAEQVVDIIPF